MSFSLVMLMACRTGEESKEGWGTVVKVIDGDTFDLLTEYNKSIRIRLSGIDAPERGMPYNKVAKEYLGRLCANRRIRYVRQDVDRYGRIIAKCYLSDGRNVESEMLRAGLAWHYRRYSSDRNLQALEDGAREARRGLWHEANPTAPWDYRKSKRNN